MFNLFEDFCKDRLYLKGASPLTIKSYRQAFNRFVESGATEISKPALNAFVVYMNEQGLAATTCNISIRSLNAFLSWLYENEHTQERFKIKQLKTEKKVIKSYTDEELQKVLSFTPKGFYAWRLYALICLLVDTGIRIDEAIRLRRDSIDFDNMLITVRGKGNKERIVPISIELRKILYRYLRQHHFDAVFCARSGNPITYRNILKEWRTLCEELKIPYRPFHQLRHNFALSFIREGGDVFTLQRLLGHSSLQTTNIYVNLQTEDLKNAHSKTSILKRLK